MTRLALPGLLTGLAVLIATLPVRQPAPEQDLLLGRVVNGRAVTVPQVPGRPPPLSEADKAIQVEIRTPVPVVPP